MSVNEWIDRRTELQRQTGVLERLLGPLEVGVVWQPCSVCLERYCDRSLHDPCPICHVWPCERFTARHRFEITGNGPGYILDEMLEMIDLALQYDPLQTVRLPPIFVRCAKEVRWPEGHATSCVLEIGHGGMHKAERWANAG